MIHLPLFISYIAYGTVGVIVFGLLILVVLKIRNRNLR